MEAVQQRQECAVSVISVIPNLASLPLAGAPCFIETQFPVVRVAMAICMERTAKQSQTLTSWSKRWRRKQLSGDGFGGSLSCKALFAVQQTVKSEEARDGLNWLKTELPDYWTSREKIVHVLDFLAALRYAAPMTHRQKDAAAAGLLAGAVRNDDV
jgi:hypothetical protein